MSIFDESIFFTAFKAVGFTVRVRVKPSGKPSVDVDVLWNQPDDIMGGSLSRQYQMEYQHADLPTLAEGDSVLRLDADAVPINGEKYIVRSKPVIQDNPGDSRSGFFRHALLTQL